MNQTLKLDSSHMMKFAQDYACLQKGNRKKSHSLFVGIGLDTGIKEENGLPNF